MPTFQAHGTDPKNENRVWEVFIQAPGPRLALRWLRRLMHNNERLDLWDSFDPETDFELVPPERDIVYSSMAIMRNGQIDTGEAGDT